MELNQWDQGLGKSSDMIFLIIRQNGNHQVRQTQEWPPKDVHDRIPVAHLTWQKELSRRDYGQDFERRRWSWVLWAGPVSASVPPWGREAGGSSSQKAL